METDVENALPAAKNRLPKYLKDKIPELKGPLKELAEVRGPSFYGYERMESRQKKHPTRNMLEVLGKVEGLVKLGLKFMGGTPRTQAVLAENSLVRPRVPILSEKRVSTTLGSAF